MATVLEVADRTDWLDARRRGIGGSDAAAVLGVSPYATPLSVYVDKIGHADPVEMNEAMRWGLRLENIIAEVYAERFDCGFIGEQVFLQSDEHPFMLATLDRLRDDGVITEFKTVGRYMADQWGEDGSQDIPVHIAAQAQHQLSVAKKELNHVVALICGQELRVYPIERDDKIISRMVEIEAEFWGRVERRDPPPATQPCDVELMSRLYRGQVGEIDIPDEIAAKVDRWQAIGREVSALEEERKLAKMAILEHMKDAASGTLPDGRVLTRKIVQVEEQVITRKAYEFVDLRTKKGVRR